MGTGPVLVVAVRVLSLDFPSVVAPAFTAFDASASFATSALSSFFKFGRHEGTMMVRTTPFYPADPTPETCFSSVSVTGASKTVFAL